MSVPMEKLDDLVAKHLEDRLLQPDRLEVILAAVLDRRQEQTTRKRAHVRSEEHTSELQSLMRISYAVFCLKKKKTHNTSQINNKKKYYQNIINNILNTIPYVAR